MTATTKIIWIFLLVGACALALALFPRNAGGVAHHGELARSAITAH